MTRKKTAKALVKVLRSFNGMRRGEEAVLPLTGLVQGWIAAGFMEVVQGGQDQAGQSGPEQDADERLPLGTEGGEPTGGEQGQGFGAGSYGASEGFDQG